jgi:transposase InsO family protein
LPVARDWGVGNKVVYRVFKATGLLQRPRLRQAALYQAARLFELLPAGPNELWQADVTYLHIPGHGWWYAVTVIDYYSRYLLARHFRAHIDGQYSHVRIQYRTPTQLGLLERFHQTLKTEEVYWRLYRSPGEARESLEVFRRRYNDVRPHWALIPTEGGDPVTPTDVSFHGQAVQLPKWQGWAKAARKKLEDRVADAHFPIASGETATTVVT